MGQWAQGEYDRVMMEKVRSMFQKALQHMEPDTVDRRFKTFLRVVDPDSAYVRSTVYSLVKNVLYEAERKILAAERSGGSALPSSRRQAERERSPETERRTRNRRAEAAARPQTRSRTGTPRPDAELVASPPEIAYNDDTSPAADVPGTEAFSMTFSLDHSPPARSATTSMRRAPPRAPVLTGHQHRRPLPTTSFTDAGLDTSNFLPFAPTRPRSPPAAADSRAWLAEYTSAAQDDPNPSSSYTSSHLWRNSPIWRISEPEWTPPMRRTAGSRSNLRAEFTAAEADDPATEAPMVRGPSGESLSRGLRRRYDGLRRRYEDMLHGALEEGETEPMLRTHERDDDGAAEDGRRQRRRVSSRRPVSEVLSGRDESGRDTRREGIVIEHEDLAQLLDEADEGAEEARFRQSLVAHYTHEEGPIIELGARSPSEEWINFGPII